MEIKDGGGEKMEKVKEESSGMAGGNPGTILLQPHQPVKKIEAFNYHKSKAGVSPFIGSRRIPGSRSR